MRRSRVSAPQRRSATAAAVLAVLIGLLMSVTRAHDGDHSLTGEWHLSHHESDVLPVHAALLPTEQVLIMAGSGNDPTYSRGINEARLWDPVTEEVYGAPVFSGANLPAAGPPTLNDNDTFCSGHVFLPDGHFFVAGGNLEYPNFHGGGFHDVHVVPPNYDGPELRPACHDFLGLRDSFFYHPDTRQWTRGPKMERGRWYPSLLSLGDGRVMAMSGLDDIGQGGVISNDFLPNQFDNQGCRFPVLNPGVEIFNPATSSWGARKVPGAGEINPNNWGLYPYVHLLPTGKVFLAMPTGNTEVFDPVTLVREGAQKITKRGGRDYGYSTLLALRPEEGYRARVLNVGGANNIGVTNQAEIIDFSAADPQWNLVASMKHARVQGVSALLPNGKVFVAGGSSGGDSNHNAHLEAEIYDPVANTWNSAGMMSVPRLYHSVAIVLADGRVFVAGSNPHDTLDPNERVVETRIEVYSPPYLFKGPRPNIVEHPDDIHYATNFSIHLGSATEVNEASQVVLLRPGSTTHTRNFDQRLVGLTFMKNPDFPDQLFLTGPPHRNIVPPGDYMLFVVDSNGIPSHGHFVRLS